MQFNVVCGHVHLGSDNGRSPSYVATVHHFLGLVVVFGSW
jgi:hypothetical protein